MERMDLILSQMQRVPKLRWSWLLVREPCF